MLFDHELHHEIFLLFILGSPSLAVQTMEPVHGGPDIPQVSVTETFPGGSSDADPGRVWTSPRNYSHVTNTGEQTQTTLHEDDFRYNYDFQLRKLILVSY